MARKGTPRGFKSTTRGGMTKHGSMPSTVNLGNRYKHSYLSLHPDPLPGVEMPEDEPEDQPEDD